MLDSRLETARGYGAFLRAVAAAVLVHHPARHRDRRFDKARPDLTAARATPAARPPLPPQGAEQDAPAPLVVASPHGRRASRPARRPHGCRASPRPRRRPAPRRVAPAGAGRPARAAAAPRVAPTGAEQEPRPRGHHALLARGPHGCRARRAHAVTPARPRRPRGCRARRAPRRRPPPGPVAPTGAEQERATTHVAPAGAEQEPIRPAPLVATSPSEGARARHGDAPRSRAARMLGPRGSCGRVTEIGVYGGRR